MELQFDDLAVVVTRTGDVHYGVVELATKTKLQITTDKGARLTFDKWDLLQFKTVSELPQH